jgi:hypothetical protein
MSLSVASVAELYAQQYLNVGDKFEFAIEERMITIEGWLVDVKGVGVIQGANGKTTFSNPTSFARAGIKALVDETYDKTLNKFVPHVNGWKDVCVNGEPLFKIRKRADKAKVQSTGERRVWVCTGTPWQMIEEKGTKYFWNTLTNDVQLDEPANFYAGVEIHPSREGGINNWSEDDVRKLVEKQKDVLPMTLATSQQFGIHQETLRIANRKREEPKEKAAHG